MAVADYKKLFFRTQIICFLIYIFSTTLTVADDLQKAENWFANVTTMRADFTQIASDGSVAEGQLVLRRPSSLKIIYQSNPPLILITTPFWLHIDQPVERELTSYPIDETPLSLILTDPVSLRPAGYTTRVMERTGGITEIAIKKESGEGAGQLTLEFADQPFQLRRWIIDDVAGVKTSVTLQNIVFSVPAKNEEFRLPRYTPQ